MFPRQNTPGSGMPPFLASPARRHCQSSSSSSCRPAFHGELGTGGGVRDHHRAVGRQGRGDFPTVDSVPPDGNRDWPGQYVDVRAAPRSTFKIIQLARRDAVQTAVPMKSQTHNIQIARFLICLPRTNGGFCSLFFLNETDLPS